MNNINNNNKCIIIIINNKKIYVIKYKITVLKWKCKISFYFKKLKF